MALGALYRLFGESCLLFKPHGSLNWRYCRACQKLDVTAGLKSTQDTDPLCLEFLQVFRIGRRQRNRQTLFGGGWSVSPLLALLLDKCSEFRERHPPASLVVRGRQAARESFVHGEQIGAAIGIR